MSHYSTYNEFFKVGAGAVGWGGVGGKSHCSTCNEFKVGIPGGWVGLGWERACVTSNS